MIDRRRIMLSPEVEILEPKKQEEGKIENVTVTEDSTTIPIGSIFVTKSVPFFTFTGDNYNE